MRARGIEMRIGRELPEEKMNVRGARKGEEAALLRIAGGWIAIRSAMTASILFGAWRAEVRRPLGWVEGAEGELRSAFVSAQVTTRSASFATRSARRLGRTRAGVA